jgi:hypothetical protein
MYRLAECSYRAQHQNCMATSSIPAGLELPKVFNLFRVKFKVFKPASKSNSYAGSFLCAPRRSLCERSSMAENNVNYDFFNLQNMLIYMPLITASYSYYIDKYLALISWLIALHSQINCTDWWLLVDACICYDCYGNPVSRKYSVPHLNLPYGRYPQLFSNSTVHSCIFCVYSRLDLKYT